MTTPLRLATAAALVMAFAQTASAEGDPAKGEKVFKKCKVCHAVGEGAKKKVGPALNNIIGAKAGIQEGYKYSKAMKKAGEEGLVWTEDKLSVYLEKPKKLIKGTKMVFPGLKKETDRDNVIAYLKKFTKSE
ncbi:MAG: c-type cytochrome [Methyloligellaceae bacterium]